MFFVCLCACFCVCMQRLMKHFLSARPKIPLVPSKIALSNEKRIFTMRDAYCDPGMKLSCFQLKMVFYQSLEITRASSYGWTKVLQNLLDHADKVDATLSDHGILGELADGRSTHFMEETESPWTYPNFCWTSIVGNEKRWETSTPHLYVKHSRQCFLVADCELNLVWAHVCVDALCSHSIESVPSTLPRHSLPRPLPWHSRCRVNFCDIQNFF